MRRVVLLVTVAILMAMGGCDTAPPSVDAGIDADTVEIISDDAAVDGDVDADAEILEPCSRPLVVTGDLSTAAGDVDFSTARAEVSLWHRLDFDLEGDGCVVQVELKVRTGEDCELSLLFSSFGPNTPLMMSTGSLTIDPACSEWPSALAGTSALYSNDLRIDAPLRVTERLAEEVCLEGITLRLEGSVRTLAGNGDLDLSGITVRGDVVSRGDDGLLCPCTTDCPAADGDGDADTDADGDGDDDGDGDFCGTPADCAELALEAFNLTVPLRIDAGCEPFLWHPAAAAVAAECAMTMAVAENMMACGDFFERLIAGGVSVSYATPSHGFGVTIAGIQEQLMSYGVTADNMVDCDLTHVGIGLATGGSGEHLYFEHIYLAP